MARVGSCMCTAMCTSDMVYNMNVTRKCLEGHV